MLRWSLIVCYFFFFMACAGKTNSDVAFSRSSTHNKLIRDLFELIEDASATNAKDVVSDLPLYEGMVFPDKMADTAKAQGKIRFLGRAFYKNGTEERHVFSIIKYKYLFQVVCSQDKRILHIGFIDFTDIEGTVTFYDFGIRDKTKDKLVDYAVGIGINDQSVEFVRPIRAWVLDFSQNKFIEVSVTNLEVAVQHY